VGPAQRRSVARFTIELSLSFNVLATIEKMDRVGRLCCSVATRVGKTGPTARDRLGGSDRRRGVLPRKKRGAGVAYGKDGKGTKLMILTDGEGTPLAVTLAGANRAEVTRIEPLIEHRVTRRKPKRLLYDPAADSDSLRNRLKLQNVELICPHRKNRTRAATQDGRSLRRYKRRYRVERTISWLKNHRRIATRYEYYPHLFHGFAQLACLFTILKRF
jgi:transposase